jgi:hypothetical protein
MGQSRLNTERRAVRVAFLCAALAFLAGAAVGLALLSATSDGVTVSNAAAIATPTAAGHSVVAVSVISSLPRIMLDMSSSGEGDTEAFTVEGSAWRLDLVCSGAGPITITATFGRVDRWNATTNLQDRLAMACPSSSSGDKASATFPDTGRLSLHVTAASTLDWEIIVTDLP